MNKQRYCPYNVKCIKGAGCHDLCVELDNPNIGFEKLEKKKGNYFNELLKKYGRN